LAEIIGFRMLMIAAGYENGNDADVLRRHVGLLSTHRRRPIPIGTAFDFLVSVSGLRTRIVILDSTDQPAFPDHRNIIESS
jgi:hypothetical protein